MILVGLTPDINQLLSLTKTFALSRQLGIITLLFLYVILNTSWRTNHLKTMFYCTNRKDISAAHCPQVSQADPAEFGGWTALLDSHSCQCTSLKWHQILARGLAALSSPEKRGRKTRESNIKSSSGDNSWWFSTEDKEDRVYVSLEATPLTLKSNPYFHMCETMREKYFWCIKRHYLSIASCAWKQRSASQNKIQGWARKLHC